MEIKRYILVQWLTESRFGKTKFGIPSGAVQGLRQNGGGPIVNRYRQSFSESEARETQGPAGRKGRGLVRDARVAHAARRRR